MEKFDFSFILPCYNEEEIFNDSVERIIKVLDGTDYTWEIIFINDKSKDKTMSLINKVLKNYSRKNLSAYFHQKNQGRGATVKEGFLKSQGKIVGFLDIDLEVGEWYIPKFIQTIENGADMAIACRVYDLNLSGLVRWVGSKGYVVLRKLVLGLPYKDTEAGYKFFRKKRCLGIFKKSNNKTWFWDTEIMALAYQSKLKVVEIPVAFVRRRDKTSTVKLIPDTIRYLEDLIKFKFKN